jgi:hypothetical protein
VNIVRASLSQAPGKSFQGGSAASFLATGKKIIPGGGGLEVNKIGQVPARVFKPDYDFARAFRSKRSPTESG